MTAEDDRRPRTDIASTLTEIATLSVDDRIQIVQAIWDGIAAEQADIGLTEAQRPDLDRRIAELDRSPRNVLTWDEIKARIRDRQ